MFPPKLLATIEEGELETKDFDRLYLNLLFCYGAQQEIVYAVKKLAEKVKKGVLEINEITVDSMKESLWTAGMPDPDLIIRTGNVIRLSNFLLYQAAYSEFLFLDCYWPEITEEILQNCLNKFTHLQRNFGT